MIPPFISGYFAKIIAKSIFSQIISTISALVIVIPTPPQIPIGIIDRERDLQMLNPLIPE
jgi:hypothetical protein